MTRDPFELTRPILERHYLNGNMADNVQFWIGPGWNWVPVETYLNRLQNIELFTSEKLNWTQHAPVGLIYIYEERNVGYKFDIPLGYRQEMATNANRRFGIKIKENTDRIRSLWEACIYSGFQPIFLIGVGDYHLPEAIVVPTEEDAVMISALWSADD